MGGLLIDKKVLFIYNPYSGKGKIKDWLEDIILELCKSNYEVIVYPTQGPKDAINRITRYTEEFKEMDTFDLILCSGGDGTLDEVVKGILKNNLDITLGYIPSGTVNDFASSLGIPTDVMLATDKVINGKTFKCDIGSFNDEYFTYVAAFGLFTSVAYSTDQDLKNSIGKLAYFLEGVKSVGEVPTYKIRIESDTFNIADEYIFGMITNSSSVGGIKTRLLETSEFNDGLFEVTLIKAPKTLNEINETAKAIMSRDFKNTSGIIQSFKASKLKITCDKDVAWTLDGENGGSCKEVIIKNHKQVLNIKI